MHSLTGPSAKVFYLPPQADSGRSDLMQVFFNVYMFLKKERPEMDDFSVWKDNFTILWKNKKESLMDTLYKTVFSFLEHYKLFFIL